MLNLKIHNHTLPPLSSLVKYEGKGNWAIKKYYKFPTAYFYRKKLDLIFSMMKPKYKSIMDFGSGPGILSKELHKRADSVVSFDIGDVFDPRWKFDLIICASVLEFVQIRQTLLMLSPYLKPKGEIIVSSPMDTQVTDAYFRLVGDTNHRNSHQEIKLEISKLFNITEYKEWMNLYFALKAV